jgi:hypothetical protein
MKRIAQCLFALVLAAGGLVATQQPASALSEAVVLGGGWMDSASGPSLAGTPVSGSIAGTAVATLFGTCSLSGTFNGIESIVAGNGGGGFTCGPLNCGFNYSRVGHEMVLNAGCSGGYNFQAGGFAEPNSVLPTTSYLFQVGGPFNPAGVIAIQGNLSFSPGAPVGVDLGNLTQNPTVIHFSGTMYGFLGGFIPSCSLNLNGSGNESFALGQATLFGTCSGPGFVDNCVINWAHVGTQAILTGNCSGPLGFTLAGVGELLLTGSSFTFVGAVTIV